MKKLLITAIALLSLNYCMATEIEIFTDTQDPVVLDSNQAGLKVNYYNLDIGINALNSLNQQVQGLQNVTQVQNVLTNPTLQNQLKQLKGNVLASSYGLTAYPAIVFDQKAVVYGYTSVQSALKVYQSWQVQNSGS